MKKQLKGTIIVDGTEYSFEAAISNGDGTYTLQGIKEVKKMTFQAEAEWSKEENKPKDWQWALHGIFLPLSVLITMIGSFIMKLGNILMFDTHHLEITVKSKK